MSPRFEKKKVPILMYHSISNHASKKFRQFTVSPALFADHMAYLYQHAYTPITITQFINAPMQDESSLPERPVVLTFDDGFADFFTEALPVLKLYSFTATLYVTTGFINSTSRWLQREGELTRPILTWDQLTEISEYGIECGAHSHSHPQLDVLPRANARDEILQSKRILEGHLGQEVLSFAYPFGYHSAGVQHLVQAAGYLSACAVKHAMSSETTDPFALARLIVTTDTSIDALEELLSKRSPSMAMEIFSYPRIKAWQLARRWSASPTRYLREGLLAH